MEVNGVDAISRKAENTAATRMALVAAARELFAERGYGATGTEEIVRRARVTRGALYHHFAGKEGLFRAVFADVDREVVERVVAAAGGTTDPWSRLVAGCLAFLDACLDPGVQRILLLDGPAVLGWTAWRELEGRSCLGLLRPALQTVIDAGLLSPQPVELLAQMLFGALTEAALLVARAADVPAARADAGACLVALLEGLRRLPAAGSPA
jgi:AcrR family transcriptional regulator